MSSVRIVGMHFAPETTGNAPYTTSLAKILAGAGMSVGVLTGVPHYPQWRVQGRYRFGLGWREVMGDVKVRRVRHAVPRRPNFLGRMRMEFTFLCQALPNVLADRSDVVIAISPTLSGLAASVLGSRGRSVGVLVQDLNALGARETGVASGRASNLIGKVEYWLLRRADLVGVITPRFGEIICQEGGVARERVVELPNFSHVRPVEVTRDNSRSLLGWPEDRFIAVHTGNMGQKQGLDVLTDVAARRNSPEDPLLVLVGDGNQRADLQRRALGLKNILFVDPLDSSLYPHALNAADVLLVTEKSGVKEMSFPSKLTSYAVASKPIVASVDAEGITGGMLTACSAAFITEAGCADQLADAIDRVRDSLGLADQLTAGSARLRQSIGGEYEAADRYIGFARRLLVGQT